MEELKGSFVESLKRNNKQIREDRALSIGEDAEMFYERMVRDLERELRGVKRDRENLLDLAGDSTLKIITPSEFNAAAFVKTDMELGIKIRDLQIRLEIALKRYTDLFGVELPVKEKLDTTGNGI